MKKILLVMLMLGLCVNAFGADQWAKDDPAGTRNASDLDTYVTVNNEALDRLLYLTRVNCTVIPNTVATLTVLPGTLALPNSDGSVVRWRRNTANTSVTWANIDTGSEAVSTQYYVWGVGDADATTFTIMISTSASAPTGATYYRKIGYFYNDASGNIVSVGNIKEGDVPNTICVTGTTDITTTSTSYTDMTDMVVYFVSSGRSVTVTFNAPIGISATSNASYAIDIDGTDKVETFFQDNNDYRKPISMGWSEVLSAGAHTIKVQWKNSSVTSYQDGASYGARVLTVRED